MAVIIDRGFVAVRDETDDTTTVMVCAEIRRGEAVGVYALHSHSASVVIDKDVRLRRAGAIRHTDRLAEVSRAEDGAVYIRSIDLQRKLG
jgi:hypothetical protein